MKKFMSAVALACLSNVGIAETWVGEGKLYNLHRELLSEYHLEVQVEPVSPTEELITVNVTSKAGAIIHTDSCRSQKNSQSWTKVCDGGRSSGFMLDYGLGIDYYEATDGKAYASDIVIDSKTQMRIFRTEIVAGQAQRFFAEVLTRR